nr:uncharacterized protein LOC109161274 [Ipomoea batatas]
MILIPSGCMHADNALISILLPCVIRAVNVRMFRNFFSDSIEPAIVVIHVEMVHDFYNIPIFSSTNLSNYNALISTLLLCVIRAVNVKMGFNLIGLFILQLSLHLCLLSMLCFSSPRTPYIVAAMSCPNHRKVCSETFVGITKTIKQNRSPSAASVGNIGKQTLIYRIVACDLSSQYGFVGFHSDDAEVTLLQEPAPVVLRTFFVTVGADVELCFMRTFGYMLAKWLILREVGGVGLQSLTPQYLGISYSTEAYGLWILKGYAPVRAMRCTLRRRERNPFPVIEAQESALRYALAHQQLEAVIQFEYTVGYFDGFIQVNARLDNIRLHVARLGFNKSEDDAYVDEKHFPSRIRVWVGPEVGASYVGGMSLGQSTNNIEKEVETHKIWKGSFGDSKVPKMKAVARMATKTKMKNWRWDQDAEGNAVVYDATLCDNQTGIEVATWKPDNGDDGPTGVVMNNLGRRYRGANRGFTKKGSLVIAGEESGTGVGWRLSKEMVGSVLKWRIGGEIWLTYWPNHVNTSYYETRCVEWCDEKDCMKKVTKVSLNDNLYKS